MPEQGLLDVRKFGEMLMKLKKKNPKLAKKLYWEWVYRNTPGEILGEGTIHQGMKLLPGAEERMGEVIEPRLYDPQYPGIIRNIYPNPHQTRDKMIRVRLRKPKPLRI